MYSSSSDDEDNSPVIESLDISNDIYYQPKPGFTLETNIIENNINDSVENRIEPIKQVDAIEIQLPQYGSETIRHSLAAYDLWRPFFPAYLSEEKFRNFHRPKLRHYNTGPQAKCYHKRKKPIPIKSVTRFICQRQKKLRADVIESINSGLSREEIINKHLLIRSAKDLTAKYGELFLFEYSEEYPPVLSQNGMALNVKTLIQQSGTQPNLGTLKNRAMNKQNPSTNDNNPNNGNSLDANQSNQQINQGQNHDSIDELQRLGNYKIGEDKIITSKNTTKQTYYNPSKPGTKLQVIENNLYRAPIYPHQVPSCDFLVIRTRNNIYIRSIQSIFTVGQTMPLVQVPQPTDNAIQKFRLSLSNMYIHKLFMESDKNPPTLDLDYLLKLFPDYHRETIYKRTRLNGAIYDKNTRLCYAGENCKYGKLSKRELRTNFTPEQYCLNMAMLCARQRLRELNYTESMINPTVDAELETEVLAAPWNTSRAVLSALTGRNYLDLKNHLIDPTGPQREGFSCVAWVKSPTEAQQAKNQLTSQSNQNESLTSDKSSNSLVQMKNPMADKIRREKLERLAIYQREAQIIADVQSRVLSSNENLSSDEDEVDSIAEEEDGENELDKSIDEQLKDLDRILTAGKSISELNAEKEEEERRKMIREFNCENADDTSERAEQEVELDSINVSSYKNKILKIIRTYNSDEGPIQRTEIVREPKIMALYVKHRRGVGGSSANSQNKVGRQNGVTSTNRDANYDLGCRKGNLNNTIGCFGDLRNKRDHCNDHDHSLKRRRSSISLGQGELCRADGMVLTISKRVLDPRLMRNQKRSAKASQSQIISK